MLKRITAATTLAVSLEKTKERLNVLHDDWDRDIEALIRAAMGTVEHETGMALQPSTWEERLDCWEWPMAINLFPVRNVDAVKYLDADGNEQTVDAANWVWDRTAYGAEINFNRNWVGLPSSYYNSSFYMRPGVVRVRFTAGYSDPATDVGSDSELTIPPEVQLAVCFLVGTWLEFRESALDTARHGQILEVPHAFKYITSQLKVYR